jgi:hypothetical protein
MRRLDGSIAIFAVALVLAVLPSSALAGSGPARGDPLVLHPHFHLVASRVESAAAHGTYLFFTTYGAATGKTATLLDTRTGKRTTLSPPACDSAGTAVFGGPWLALSCSATSGTVDLYDLATGAWRTVATGCQFDRFIPGGCSVVGVGRDWIRFEFSCYHCTDTFQDQSLLTGGVRKDPEVAGGTTIADLDSPSLTAKLCRPLRVPSSSAPTPDGGTEPGALTWLGNFALATVQPGGGEDATEHLEHCGTSLQRRLAFGAIGNTKAVVWVAKSGGLAGLLLPSLRPVSVKVPNGMSGVSGTVLLGQKMLYLGARAASGEAELWAAFVPRL